MNKNELKPSIRFKGFTDAWEKREFGSLFTEYIEKGDFSLKPLSIKQGVGTVVRSQSDFNIKWDLNTLLNSKIVHKDDFILHLRSFEGGLEKANSDGLISPAYRTFRGLNINSEFYYICLRSFEFINNQLSSHVYGIRDGKTIDIEGLKSIKLPYTNIEEQKCIADFLVVFSYIITFYKRKSEKLENLKKSLLEKMFVSDGEQFPAIRFKGFTNTWEKSHFSNFYSFASEGGTPNTLNDAYYANGKIPFVKIEDTQEKYICQVKNHITELGLENSSAWLVPSNSLILTNGATIGNVAINKIKTATKQGILGIIVKNIIDVEYFYYLLNTEDFKRSLNEKATIGTFASITLNAISKIKLSWTKNKDEQIHISNFFSVVDNLITFYKRKCDKLENIKKSLLEKMFC
ncbi:restriction endonuclease subunit S [Mycoplasma sp. VS1572C]